MDSNDVIKKIVVIALELAQPSWGKLRVEYRYYDRVADQRVLYLSGNDEDWKSVSDLPFTLMDEFDSLRAITHPGSSKPWTGVTIIIDLNSNNQYEVNFKYEIPDMFVSD